MAGSCCMDASIQQLPSIQQPFTEKKQEATASTSIFKSFTQKHQAHFIEKNERSELKHWKEILSGAEGYESSESGVGSRESENAGNKKEFPTLKIDNTPLGDGGTQLLNTYITVPSKNGFLLIHQQSAHERILYEQLKAASTEKPVATRRSMYPATLELVPADAAVMEEIIADLQQLGYIIEPFGKNTFVIQGTPADVGQGNEKYIIDILLEQYKHFSNEVKFSKREKLIRSLARQQSIKTGVQLTEREMRQLVNNLFACEQPNVTPDGNPTYLEFKQEQLEKMFKG